MVVEMETRVCSKCHIEKPTDEFRLRNRYTKRRQSHCIECGSKMVVIGMNEIKSVTYKPTANTKIAKAAARKFVYQYLIITHPCTKCGEIDPDVLEFHHVGEKGKEIGRIIAQGYGVEAISAKMSQCIVANCHRRLTAKKTAGTNGESR